MPGVLTDPTPMRPPRGSMWSVRVVWAITLMGLVTIGVSTWMSIDQAGPGAKIEIILVGISQSISLAAFLMSGAIIVARQPRNVVGWLLMVPGLALPADVVAGSWLASIDPPPEQVDPLIWVLVWATSWAWLVLIFPIFGLVQTFPDGRLLSPRWRWLIGLETAMVMAFVGSVTLANQMQVLVNDQLVWSVPNPIGFLDAEAVWSAGFGTVFSLGLLAVTVASVISVVIRYRRGTPEARHQLKWPILAIGGFGIVYGIGSVFQGPQGALWNILFEASIAAIPISVAIAVLKYRLYEIDRIVSRTISYLILTVVLAVVFVGAILLFQAVLSPLLGENPVAVAASTLIVAALFQPLRSRVQRVVDRRFNRSRYDAERIASAFSDRLRDQVDLPALVSELVATVDASLRPGLAGLWLRDRPEAGG